VRKIRLLKLDITVPRTTFVTYSAGILFKKVSLSVAERAVSPIETIFNAEWDDELPEEKILIGTLRVNNIRYFPVSTLNELNTQPMSFYFDFDNQIIYYTNPDWKNPLAGDNYKTGETVGFMDNAQLKTINGFKFPIDTMIDGLSFEPRLGTVSAPESIDDQQNGIFVYDELSVDFNNGDGVYDTLKQESTGNLAELLIADLSDSEEEEISSGFPFKDAADSTDFKTVRQGIIDNVSYLDPNVPTISAIDPFPHCFRVPIITG
jgi:hypothetical protein